MNIFEVCQFDNVAPLIIIIKWIKCFTGCPFEWVNHRDKCYFFSKDLHSFDDAKKTCESMTASLLIINDMEEQVTDYGCVFLHLKMKSTKNNDVMEGKMLTLSVLVWPQKWLKKQTFGKGYFWMGLTDREEENFWRWLDGTEPAFTSVLNQKLLPS